jgi:hypothetical protein
MTGMEKLDNVLNQMKTHALEYLNYILRYIFEKIPNVEKKKSTYLMKCVYFSPYLCRSLISACKMPGIMKACQEEIFGELIIEAIETIAYFCGESEF